MGLSVISKGMSLSWIDRILKLVSNVRTLFTISGKLK